jgi:hypothetical protein
MCGLEFPINHRLFEIFDEKLERLFEAGIIDHYLDDWVKVINPKRYEHLYPDEPKVLTLKTLEAGFVICLISISFSFIAFIGEWVIKIIELFVIMKIFGQFYQQRKATCTFNSKKGQHSIKVEIIAKPIIEQTHQTNNTKTNHAIKSESKPKQVNTKHKFETIIIEDLE